MQVVALSCSNCGGKLEIRQSVSSLACGYCGANLVVQREGGAIFLNQVAEGISAVRVGTDKTAAELALVRLEKDKKDLDARWREQKAAQEKLRSDHGMPYLVGSLVGVFFGICASLGFGNVIPFIIGALIACMLLFFWNKSVTELNQRFDAANVPMKEEARALKAKIAAQKTIVDS